MLVVHEFPEPDESLVDADAENEVEQAIDLVRRVRRWRDLAGIPPSVMLTAWSRDELVPEFAERLGRFENMHGDGAPVARVAGLEIFTSSELDPGAIAERIGARRKELTDEIERSERKLANEGFVSKAPPEVVAEERAKLERYHAERDEL